MPRKKNTEEQNVKKVSKLVVKEPVQVIDAPKKKKVKEVWPKVVKGSHLTVITHENGKTELEWDDDALLKDVQKALTEYENSVKVNTVKTTKRKKKNEA
jgi:ABC-type Mn2+/Zn2+ transport system ATPase subunit